jgi:hypothetical protein
MVEKANADLLLNNEWSNMNELQRTIKLIGLKNEDTKAFLTSINEQNKKLVAESYGRLQKEQLYPKWRWLTKEYQDLIMNSMKLVEKNYFTSYKTQQQEQEEHYNRYSGMYKQKGGSRTRKTSKMNIKHNKKKISTKRKTQNTRC